MRFQFFTFTRFWASTINTSTSYLIMFAQSTTITIITQASDPRMLTILTTSAIPKLWFLRTMRTFFSLKALCAIFTLTALFGMTTHWSPLTKSARCSDSFMNAHPVTFARNTIESDSAVTAYGGSITFYALAKLTSMRTLFAHMLLLHYNNIKRIHHTHLYMHKTTVDSIFILFIRKLKIHTENMPKI